MTDSHPDFEYDVFVSYRWAEPDQSWVRDHLVPALQQAGLRVCLDVNDFVPGRDLILEMARAGQSSRRALCILSEDYFAGNRMVHFESLTARRHDPGGFDSLLVPLLLRPTNLPDWLRGLIPVDWTDQQGRDREWRKLLKVLNAPKHAVPPSTLGQAKPTKGRAPIFVHDYNLPQTFVARETELRQLKSLVIEDGSARPSVLAVTAIGGVGKSCLCRQLIEQDDVAPSYSRVIWFSFYESRGEAEGYFFHEVLGRGFNWIDRDKPLEGTKENVRLRRALSDRLESETTLLVLDGLEVIQFTDDPAAANFGAIKPTWTEIDKLLRHVLNQPVSICLITSRVPLRHFEHMRGYRHVPLDLFTPIDGAHLLRSLGLEGDVSTLAACAENLGGHALSLVAAGRYMARRKISAEHLGDLVEDPLLFRRTPEGERVKRISEWYRSELTPQQEYFLTRLSLHGRSVSAANYPVLVREYLGAASDSDVENQIIDPLVERGLVERLDGGDSGTRFTAHPLMKLAFSTWLEPDERKRAREEWARAAAGAPSLFFGVARATTLEGLQPLIDATEQYLAAENWREASAVFIGRGLSSRLGQLGYFQLSLKLALQLVEIPAHTNQINVYEMVLLLDHVAWLYARLGMEDMEIEYRRKELAAAPEAGPSVVSAAQRVVAGSLARAGFVSEAAEIRPNDVIARAKIALAQGRYTQAASLLRKAIKGENGHDWTTTAQPLAEALYRADMFQQAADVLLEALQRATDGGFTCCQKAILSQLISLELRRENLSKAQHWAEVRNELLRRLELDRDDDPWLLLAENDFDAAFKAAEAHPATSPRRQIDRHVTRARIFLKLDRRQDAEIELVAAERERSASGYGQLNNDIAALRRDLARWDI